MLNGCTSFYSDDDAHDVGVAVLEDRPWTFVSCGFVMILVILCSVPTMCMNLLTILCTVYVWIDDENHVCVMMIMCVYV